jgi:SAM-dependent methyltransferase
MSAIRKTPNSRTPAEDQTMDDELPILSDLDFGDWAAHYASRPHYGHFKKEVYPLFIEFINRLPSGSRILDIGAGPGNLEVEFFRKCARTDLSFLLVDSSRDMLRAAVMRLADCPASALRRSFNMDGWDEGIGEFDLVVSNNAIFNVKPERLDGFYAICHKHLKPGGLLLNQQSFGYVDGESPHSDNPFPEELRAFLRKLMDPNPELSDEDRQRLDEEMQEARKRREAALAEAREQGVETGSDQSGYHFLSVEHHLKSMREAGLASGCIWRKREFAVLCGLRSGESKPEQVALLGRDGATRFTARASKP